MANSETVSLDLKQFWYDFRILTDRIYRLVQKQPGQSNVKNKS